MGVEIWVKIIIALWMNGLTDSRVLSNHNTRAFPFGTSRLIDLMMTPAIR